MLVITTPSVGGTGTAPEVSFPQKENLEATETLEINEKYPVSEGAILRLIGLPNEGKAYVREASKVQATACGTVNYTKTTGKVQIVTCWSDDQGKGKFTILAGTRQNDPIFQEGDTVVVTGDAQFGEYDGRKQITLLFPAVQVLASGGGGSEDYAF